MVTQLFDDVLEGCVNQCHSIPRTTSLPLQLCMIPSMPHQGCMCCPYPLVVIPGLLVLIAVCLTSYAAFACDFFLIEVSDTSVESNKRDLHIGLWTIEDTNAGFSQTNATNYGDARGEDDYECVAWNERSLYGPASMVELDGSLSAARAFSLMAFIFGGFIGLVLIFIPCCLSFGQPRNFAMIVMLCYVIIGLFVLLDLVALSSDICRDAESCEIDAAGIVAIVASVFWFASAGLLVLALKKPRVSENPLSIGYPVDSGASQPAPTTERDVQTITNQDGSVTTITKTTVTHPDGSKTVTETTEVSELPPIADSVPLGTDSVPLAASMPVAETIQSASVLSVVREPDAEATKVVP